MRSRHCPSLWPQQNTAKSSKFSGHTLSSLLILVRFLALPPRPPSLPRPPWSPRCLLPPIRDLPQPIQRIPRYQLLITELLKHTEAPHGDRDNLTKAPTTRLPHS